MIEKNVPLDQQYDGFNEQCLEQRIGKLNNSAEPIAEASIPFRIEPKSKVLVVTLLKRVNTYSSDSGNSSTHFSSLALSFTPEILPHQSQDTFNEQPSTWAVSRPLNPIQ